MKSNLVPVVVEKDGRSERSFDLFSRIMRDRIILLGTVDEVSAKIVIAQLLFLEGEAPGKPIQLYINSRGGSVIDGLAIYDTMQLITSPVHTTCIGQAASMGSFLLAGGHPGERRCLPNSEIMIHELASGLNGKFKDMEAHFKHSKRLAEKLNQMLAENTGQKLSQIKTDILVDKWFTAPEALKYGLIDEIRGCTRSDKAKLVEEAENSE